MLVIDELHNVLGGRGDTRREFLNLLRFLGNELRIPLTGVGTRDAYLAIRSDDQLENRFAPLTLPRWEAGTDACSLLASFAASSSCAPSASSAARPQTRPFPPDQARRSRTAVMAGITSPRNLNPARWHRSCPRVVRRARHNSYRVKRPGDTGTRYHEMACGP
jgi:Bacterial TniB protein